METFWNLLKEPFVWGLALGLAGMIFVWKSSLTQKGFLKREMKRLEKEASELQSHLNTQLKINARGNEKTDRDLEQLREQNENLRVTLATYQQKPGRGELRQLQVYERAIRLMNEKAPGFGTAWERALAEGEERVEETDVGFKKLARKIVPALGMGSHSKSASEDEGEGGESSGKAS
ncbi:MAG: hypothetical protein AAF555_01735 [Verrucomicrobiota bacterium]